MMLETQDGAMKPPSLAMPMISVRIPRATASTGVSSGRPRSTWQPGRRNWPGKVPVAIGECRSSLRRRDVRRVAEEEEIRILDHDDRCLHVTV